MRKEPNCVPAIFGFSRDPDTFAFATTQIFVRTMQCRLGVFFFVCANAFFVVISACKLDAPLQGVFHRQVQRAPPTEEVVVQLEKVTITSDSSSAWGDCYETVGSDSFVFGLKRMGQGTCFRCITLLLRNPNVLQSLHQDAAICHESAMDARRACFDVASVGPGDGTLLFRAEGAVPQSCGLEGLLNFSYRRPHNAASSCSADSGSHLRNCDNAGELFLAFRNCSFPDFDQSLVCLGHWMAKSPRNQFVALFDPDTRQYRCGLLTGSREQRLLATSADGFCDKLEGGIGFEEYHFRDRPQNRVPSACRFPEWLHGEYDGMTIANDTLQHKMANAPSLTSACIESDNERIVVHSTTSCGDPIGYHCLWFQARSNSIIEFKTTTIASEATGLCRKEKEFEQASWTVLASRNPQRAPCAFFGTYSTPQEMRQSDCYDLSVDCKRRHQFKLVAYHCESRAAYDVKTYNCLGTWKEGESLFVYAQSDDVQHDNACFVSRQQGDLLYLAMIGNHCSRHFNFSEHSESALVFRRTADCDQQATKSTTTPVLRVSKGTTVGSRRYAPTSRTQTPGVAAIGAKQAQLQPQNEAASGGGSIRIANVVWLLPIAWASNFLM